MKALVVFIRLALTGWLILIAWRWYRKQPILKDSVLDG